MEAFKALAALNSLRSTMICDKITSQYGLFLFDAVNRVLRRRGLPAAVRVAVAVLVLAWEIVWRGTAGYFS